jgi:ABC-type multidrug transport system fused ATPase/permease subunit
MLLYVLAEAYRLRTADPGAFPAHELIIYIITLVNILPALRRTLEVSVVWQAGDVSIQKILRIFNAPKENKVKRDDAAFDDLSVVVKDLEFRHGDTVIFSGLDLTIRPKSLTLIKGRQGSGKSSLFKVLLGIYPFQKGGISLDGQPADMTDVYTLRKNITLVSEEVPLIGKTVFEAISYSRKEEKREKAAEMLEKLQSFLPENRRLHLDHRLVNDGANLGAGQRRTLQFARALLTRKKIVLLDDPFQGLDEASRVHFAAVIDRMRGKRTFLIASGSDIPELEFDQVVEMPEPLG